MIKKNSRQNLSLKKLLLCFVPVFLILTAIRFYEVAAAIDASTGFFKQSSALHPLFYALVVVCCLLFACYSFLSEDAAQTQTTGFRSGLMCAMAAVFGVALFLDSAGAFSSLTSIDNAGADFRSRMVSGAIPLAMQSLFALLSALYFFILAHAYRKGTVVKARLLALSPVLWAGFRMIHHFIRKISFVRVSDLFFELCMLAFMMLFFMAFASVSSAIYSDGNAWRLSGFGLPAALIAGMLNLPRMIFMFIDKTAYLNENHPFRAADCVFFCFALLLCVTAALKKNAAQENERADQEV